MSSPSVPQASPLHPVRRFPPPGPLGQVPRPRRYYPADSDPSPPVPPRFVSFARRYHSLRPRSLPRGRGDCPEGLDLLLLAAPAPLSAWWRRRGLPGSWATLCLHAPLFDPGGPPASRPLRGQAMLPSAGLNNVGSATNHFRGSITRPTGSLCTLRSRGRPRSCATLDSGWGPALSGQDSHLLGRIEGFRHVSPSTWLPPSPSFAWRKNPWVFGPMLLEIS